MISDSLFYKSAPMSERKYLPSKETALALLKEFAKASSLVAPYELRAMTRPPEVTIFPFLNVVPAWNGMLSVTKSSPVISLPFS